MAIKLTHRRMNGGASHQHIGTLWWTNDKTGVAGQSSRDQITEFIDSNGNDAVYCPDLAGGPSAWVHVQNNGYVRYPQTYADGRWTNNLLSLPLA